MLFRERIFWQRSTIDGDGELTTSLEGYCKDAVLFLPFDPEKKLFLFERRLGNTDPLRGRIVIPGGAVRDLGERRFPLWAAERELIEEYGIVAKTMVYLGEVMEKERRILLNPFQNSNIFDPVK